MSPILHPAPGSPVLERVIQSPARSLDQIHKAEGAYKSHCGYVITRLIQAHEVVARLMYQIEGINEGLGRKEKNIGRRLKELTHKRDRTSLATRNRLLLRLRQLRAEHAQWRFAYSRDLKEWKACVKRNSARMQLIIVRYEQSKAKKLATLVDQLCWNAYFMGRHYMRFAACEEESQREVQKVRRQLPKRSQRHQRQKQIVRIREKAECMKMAWQKEITSLGKSTHARQKLIFDTLFSSSWSTILLQSPATNSGSYKRYLPTAPALLLREP